MVARGDRDTYSPRFVEIARGFVEELRDASSNPSSMGSFPAAARLRPLHSIRFEAVVDGIEAFAGWVRSTRVKSRGGGAGDLAR
jgi:hypothetical protein